MMPRVLLAHGWLSGPWQVASLGKALSAAGYEIVYIRHKSWFGRFEVAVEAALAAAYVESGQKLHLVGFSLGGLVMRAVAARHPPGLASLLLIGVPNAGSTLADLVRWIMPTSSVRRLSTKAPALPDPPPGVRVGCIAGNRRGLLGLLLPAPNDTRVTIASAFAIRHNEAHIVGYNHRELPDCDETHRLAIAFLKAGD